MPNSNCPQCGNTVTDELPGGLCPSCLIEAAKKSVASLGETAAMPYEFQAPELAELARLFPELEIIEQVGRGGMGAVYRVKQKNLDRIVALKVFLYKPDDPEFAARFQREARALARLKHPNIVTVHDFGTRENTHFLIMEFVDGLNLRQISAEESLTPEMALQMVPQLCDALQYAHDNGVIHRDIKPENLLLDVDGRVKIADFGLAKMTGSGNQGTLTHTRQVMGTLNYMAPEQRERPTEVDHRVDIYSLGVVIYELLTGELPIGRFLPPSEKSELDARLDEVVMRALEKEPNLRYQQASEFKTGFASVGNDVAPQFAPMPTPVKPVKSELERKGPRLLISLMGGRERKGRWRPGNPQFVFTMMGGSCLDLTKVEAPEITVYMFTLMGASEVIVPADADVEVDGFMLIGAFEDNIKRNAAPARQRIRIQSWGAMGGSEVRTSMVQLPKDATQFDQYREPRKHEITIRDGLVKGYEMMATLVGLAAIALFILSAVLFGNPHEGRLAAIICAISCGMLWSGLEYFRRLIGAGPGDDDEATVRKYYSSSFAGTLIRCLALFAGFACPILFAIAAYENHDQSEIRLAAIITAIVSVVLFTAASYLEEFLYGKLKE